VSVPETFTWTITGPAADPRTALTANFVLADETIRLAWQNPTPDTADTIEVQYAEGPCGGSGFSHLVTLAAGTASYDWVHGFPGRSYRFRVVGISAAGVRSTPSNVACVTVGTNEISNVLVTALSETTATITWTTLMPSRSVPTLTPEPAGLVANLVAAADQKTFALSLSGLAPQTSYSLRIFADSLLRGNIAIADVPFTTIARPSIRAELVAEVVAPMRIRSVVGRYEDAYERNGVRHTVQVAVQNVEIDVRIINGTAQSVTVDDLLVTAATTLDLPCPPASNLCRSSFRTYPTTEPPASGDLLTVLEIRPAQVGTLGPGQVSEIVTVTFRVDDYVLDGLRGLFGGSGLITPDLTYSIRTAAGPVPAHSRPSARVSLPGGRMADLTLEMTAVAGMPLLPGGVVTYSLVVRNDGPTTATAVSVAAAVPAGTTFTGFDGQDWRCRLTSEAVIVCDSIASIPPGATGEPLSLALRIDAVSLSTVTLTATARAAQVDEDFSNNLASVVTPVGAVVGPGADIGLTGFATEASYEPPFPDYLVTFDVENRGPATAVGVVLSFRLEDTALRFAVPLPCEQRPSDALLVCPLGDIPAGERIPVALRLVSMRPGEQPVSVSVGAVTPEPDPTGRAGGAPNAATVRVIYDITLP
jgi:uncharacterized repeat protein (TIGR01451 family)